MAGNPSVLVYMIMAALFLGVVAGFFPAIYLSSFRPILVLKGLKFSEKGTLNLRKALVIVQFTISTVLIIGALIISQQMHFIQSAKLGLNKDQVVVVKNASLSVLDNTLVFSQQQPGLYSDPVLPTG